MKYMGSKNRYAKDILQAMYPYISDFIPVNYIEPFVGGGQYDG